MLEPDEPDRPALGPLAALARERGSEMTEAQVRRGWQRLDGNLRAPARRAPRLVGAVAALALVVGLAALGARRVTPPPLTYETAGLEVDVAGTLRPSGASPKVVFSDGTEVRLERAARGRIASIDARGARIAVEEGAAEVAVVRRTGARWSFDAGPFTVEVKGTAFRIAWSAARAELVVAMRSGEVRVTGPGARDGVAVRGTERLRVNARTGSIELRQAPPPIEPMERLPSVAPPAEEPSAERTTLRRKAPAAPPPAPRSWARLLAEGEPETVLRLAERRGISASLSGASLEDLAALADAARYLRRAELARRALLATRSRFPRTREAHDAAFLLGRLTESVGPDAALSWYDRYLAEAADGAYVAEALGRKMTVLQRLHGTDRARPVAEAYLRRFPTGSYAEAARVLAGQR